DLAFTGPRIHGFSAFWESAVPPLTVIPAQAGIQDTPLQRCGLREPGANALSPTHHRGAVTWMPTFVGMTGICGMAQNSCASLVGSVLLTPHDSGRHQKHRSSAICARAA